MIRILKILLLAILISVPVLYLAKNPPSILQSEAVEGSYHEKLETRALNGDSNAMLRMGNGYRFGYKGLPINNTEALKWYEMAAENGNADAVNNLGVMYRDGIGVEQDYERAKQLFEAAIKSGVLDASSNLGYMYKNGLGVEVDYRKSLSLFEVGAEQGHIESLGNLGWMYHDGLGTERDLRKAYDLWMQAANKGSAPAEFQIARFYDVGKGHIPKNRMEAFEWYERAAYRNYAPAQRFLAYIYYDGVPGIPKDYIKAGEFFCKSARNGNTEAEKMIKFSVKECNSGQYGHEVSTREKYCQIASCTGDPFAMYRTAKSFMHGGDSSIHKDEKKAFEWMKKSASENFPKAIFDLSKFYADGIGAEKDLKKAYSLASKLLQMDGIGLDIENQVASYRKKISADISNRDRIKLDRESADLSIRDLID